MSSVSPASSFAVVCVCEQQGGVRESLASQSRRDPNARDPGLSKDIFHLHMLLTLALALGGGRAQGDHDPSPDSPLAAVLFGHCQVYLLHDGELHRPLAALKSFRTYLWASTFVVTLFFLTWLVCKTILLHRLHMKHLSHSMILDMNKRISCHRVNINIACLPEDNDHQS